MGIAATDCGTVFLSSSKEHALFSLKEEEMLGGTETLTKVCGELQAIVMVSKVDGTSLLLYVYIETLSSYAIPVTKQ